MQNDAARCTRLNEIFAEKLVESHELRSWFVSRTKFARLWPLARLLHAEQCELQGRAPWWRSTPPGVDDPQSVQMLFLFEVEQTNLRFALHVENIVQADKLAASENGFFRTRAQAMMNQECFLNYMDFETVLLAPQALIVNDARTLNFDRRIPFETIAGFVPQFAQAHRAAA